MAVARPSWYVARSAMADGSKTTMSAAAPTRIVPRGEHSAGQAEDPGGRRRHLADGLLEAEQPFLADVLAEDLRERPEAAGMGVRPDEDPVACHDLVRVRQQPPHVVLVLAVVCGTR